MAYKSAATAIMATIQAAKEKYKAGQYQDADAAAADDPVQRKAVAETQMDASGQVDNPSTGASPMASMMPGQQGGSDALAASNKTTAQGAAATQAIMSQAANRPAPQPRYRASQLFRRRGRV